MTKQSPKIIFFGNERLATGVSTACPSFRALLEAGYDIAAVVLHNQPTISRSRRRVEIIELAEANNIPVLYPVKLADIAGELTALKAQAGVLVAFGSIISQTIIDLFPRGIVNVHPSALPKHRGPTPVESIILEGQTETAVSLMQLAREMDAGPVYAQQPVSVPGKTSKQALADSLSEIGSKMLVQYLPEILDGTLQPEPQDDQAATYDSLISKHDGAIDWRKPAAVLEREIRAYHTWPKSTATINNHELIVTEADVVTTSGKPSDYRATKQELLVHCGKDSLLIKQVQPVNKKEMPVKAFLAGYPL